uniref:NADP-dependent oxidoreductase domain-containing protein n=1 Tax=Ditylenchus dipsaci TaxID=166011 RepID=A0A915EK32_9BILA
MEMKDFQGYNYVEKWLDKCKIGLGTYQVCSKTEIFNILDAALSVGYRYIDTAQVYKNEKYIGDALKILLPKHSLKREDVFIASKLVDYIDIFLIHWPGCNKVKPSDVKNKSMRNESWACLEELYKEGKLRMSPALNQCEYHPHYYQTDLVEFCTKHVIHFQAYSSFGSESNKEEMLADKQIQAMAKKYKTCATTFLLAWSLSQEISVLPRSRNPKHVKENFEAKNLKIGAEDIELVKKKELKKYCWDPETVA